MTIGNIISLAWKYLRSHFRRYFFLLSILAFSFAVITSITTLTEGMSRNVFRAAENHYGGHVFAIGFDDGRDKIANAGEIIKTIDSSGFTYSKAVFRTMLNSRGVLHFAGSSVKQKYLFGIDWENEKSDFAELDFTDALPDFQSLENGILISSSVAEELQARVGDDLVLEVTPKDGPKNTGIFIVKGIIRDNSIFGYYKCFISLEKLNSLIGYAPGECSWIGFYFVNTEPAYQFDQAARIHSLLEKKFPMGPLVDDRDSLESEISGSDKYPGFHYSVVTLNSYISQVGDLLTAMKLISYFLYVMMIIIALASISVTYRLILHERAREIGTIRVMGMESMLTQGVLVIECLFLLFAALFAGFILALFFIWILSLFSYAWIPGFEIFLHKGRLTAAFTQNLMITNIAIMVITTLPAVWIPAARISRAKLPDILSGESHA
ncbi:MAG: FtsX-like permease family protein [Spirochaetaceae bacterium]|nr:MAG: FtsX-like permease family protein [Spirochaetaceae bacterium]